MIPQSLGLDMPARAVPAHIPDPPLAVPTPGVPLQDVPEGQGKRP